jgi:hypothetical protein
MNKPTSMVVRYLGIGRAAPRTRFVRFVRRSGRTLAVLVLLYAGLHFYPQIVFGHSVTAHGITIHSRTPIPHEAVLCQERAAKLVGQSELAVPGRRENVFVCDSPAWFRFFNPRSSGAFAASVSLTGHVFVANADFSRDIARRGTLTYNSRPLSSVMAHEIAHGLIRRRVGLWTALRLPDWVVEGYCDFVGQGSSFPETEGCRLMAEGNDHPSSAFRYFKYRQMVRYLMEEKQLSFAQLLERANDFGAVEAETREACVRISER